MELYEYKKSSTLPVLVLLGIIAIVGSYFLYMNIENNEYVALGILGLLLLEGVAYIYACSRLIPKFHRKIYVDMQGIKFCNNNDETLIEIEWPNILFIYREREIRGRKAIFNHYIVLDDGLFEIPKRLAEYDKFVKMLKDRYLENCRFIDGDREGVPAKDIDALREMFNATFPSTIEAVQVFYGDNKTAPKKIKSQLLPENKQYNHGKSQVVLDIQRGISFDRYNMVGQKESKTIFWGPDVKLYEYTSDTEQRAYYVISRDDYIRIPFTLERYHILIGILVKIFKHNNLFIESTELPKLPTLGGMYNESIEQSDDSSGQPSED